MVMSEISNGGDDYDDNESSSDDFPSGAKVQVTGQVTGYRPQVRSQDTGHRSQATGQVTGHTKNNRTLDKTVLD